MFINRSLKRIYISLGFIAIVVLQACNHSGSTAAIQMPLDSLELSYADGFRIYYHKNYKELVVRSPWNKSNSLMKYYLVKNEHVKVPLDGQKIVIPIKSIAATSVTHFEFLSLIVKKRPILLF